MMAHCTHCEYNWDYKGEALVHITCPRCLYAVRHPNSIANMNILAKEYPWSA
jgi:hypothetical protein